MKSDIYYKKDKKVKLVVKTIIEDSLGQMIPGFQYLSNSSFWAYSRQLSQSQIFEAQAHGADDIRLFVLNYRDDLKIADYIEYRGKYYSITRLDTRDDYKGELFVYVKDTGPGDTPYDVKPAEP